MKIEIYRDGFRQWRWRMVAANGEKVANPGEGYKSAISMVRTVRRYVTRDSATYERELSRALAEAGLDDRGAEVKKPKDAK
jgi:uncharacterized protein YegP (UPF0339 family)